MTRKSFLEIIKKDKGLSRWYRQLEKKSKISAFEIGKYLMRYCKLQKTDPYELLENAEKDLNIVEGRLQTFIADTVKGGKTRDYALKYLKSIKAWLDYNGIELKRDYHYKAKYLKMLDEDDNYRRWYENLERGSSVTAYSRARELIRFCDQFNLKPKDLITRSKSDISAFEDMLHDFITKLDKDGKSPGYLSNYIKTVKSWLNYNGITLMRKIKLRDSQATPTIESERVPNKIELKTILDSADLRAKVIISIMAFSGVRPQVLGIGFDGLRINDLPELKIQNNEVSFEHSPTMIVVRPSLSKAKHKYNTFLAEEGMGYLKTYLEKRLANGEVIQPDSPIIITARGYENMGVRKGNKKRGSLFLATQNISREVRKVMRPKFNWRPYVLRAYFDTQLMLSESHGKISHAYRQFFMGHKGDIEARYTTNKGRLTPETIEDMRRTYNDSEEYFCIQISVKEDPEVLVNKATREILYNLSSTTGKSRDALKMMIHKQLESMQRENLDDKALLKKEIELLQNEISKKIMPTISQSHGAEYENGFGRKHKIIIEDELVDSLNEGWELVKEINGEKYLVKK